MELVGRMGLKLYINADLLCCDDRINIKKRKN